MFTPALYQHESADCASKETLLDNRASLAIYASESAHALAYDLANKPLHDGEYSSVGSEPVLSPITDADGREYARPSTKG